VKCHNVYSGKYGQLTSTHKNQVQVISMNLVLIFCRAEGLGRPQGTPSTALDFFAYKVSRWGPRMMYFRIFEFNLTGKYTVNSWKTGRTAFFWRLDFDPLEVP
jgi:hypothetical protein